MTGVDCRGLEWTSGDSIRPHNPLNDLPLHWKSHAINRLVFGSGAVSIPAASTILFIHNDLRPE